MGISPYNPDILRAMARGQVVEHNRTNLLALGVVPEAPAEDADEEDFRVRLKELAEAHGWATYHTRDSRKSDTGFPDVVFVRERVFYAELKSRYGKQTAAQKRWAKLLKDAGQEFYLWRASDWAEAARVLALRSDRKGG